MDLQVEECNILKTVECFLRDGIMEHKTREVNRVVCSMIQWPAAYTCTVVVSSWRLEVEASGKGVGCGFRVFGLGSPLRFRV